MVSCSPGMTPRSSTGGASKRASWGGGGGGGREAVAEGGSDRVIGALHLNFNSSFSSLDNHLSKLSGIRQHFEGNGRHTRIQMHTDVDKSGHGCPRDKLNSHKACSPPGTIPDVSNQHFPQVRNDQHPNLIPLKRVTGQQKTSARRRRPHTEQRPPIRICSRNYLLRQDCV